MSGRPLSWVFVEEARIRERRLRDMELRLEEKLINHERNLKRFLRRLEHF